MTVIPEPDNASDVVLLDADERGIATVTLNRPEVHNAFNDELIERLHDIFVDLATQDGIRGVILQARGKSFSAGGDLAWMRRAAEFTPERNLEDARVLAAMLRALSEIPKITVALVQGPAYAGGMGLVSACDIAVAVRSATFALTEVRLGLAPATISPHVLRAIGPRQARRYFLTGERFDAAEAHRIGLVHELVDDQAALDAARDRLIAAILTTAPGAVVTGKALIRNVSWREVDDDLAEETAQVIADIRATDEAREGLAAFFEKRKPSWSA